MEVLVAIGQEAHFQGLDESSMWSGLESMVGTTTRVRYSGGMPSEKSMRGSARGVTSSVTTQFTRATASWLAATVDSSAEQRQEPVIQPVA